MLLSIRTRKLRQAIASLNQPTGKMQLMLFLCKVEPARALLLPEFSDSLSHYELGFCNSYIARLFEQCEQNKQDLTLFITHPKIVFATLL